MIFQEEATLNLDRLYSERPPLDDFLEWRDLRVLDEIHWYGWFIDYWMEGGKRMCIGRELDMHSSHFKHSYFNSQLKVCIEISLHIM